MNERLELSTHGPVEGKEGECVSITFGLCESNPPHAPVKSGGVCKTLTTMCDHDIGVITDE